MSKKIRVGFIGTGGIAKFHMEGYVKTCSEIAEVTACCDVQETRVKEFAKEHNIAQSYTDYKKMLRNEKLDALSICVPNAYHAKLTCDALNAGINVLVEKPMALNAKEAKMMVESAKKSKKILTVGHHHRFRAESNIVKKYISEGNLGDIYFASTRYLRRKGIPGWGKFHVKKHSGGGPLIDLSVHGIDLLMWLMDFPKPVAVCGATYNKIGGKPGSRAYVWGSSDLPDFDVEDFAFGFVRFKNGATMEVLTSWAANIPQSVSSHTLIGDKGGATIDPLGMYTQFDNALIDITPHTIEEVNPYHEEIKNFVLAVRGEAQSKVRPEQCLLTQQIIDALYLSAKKGKEIRIGN